MIVLQAFFVRSFSGLLLFWKAPERVQIMKKVNRNNGTIDVTTVGGRIKKLRTDAGYTQEELAARDTKRQDSFRICFDSDGGEMVCCI